MGPVGHHVRAVQGLSTNRDRGRTSWTPLAAPHPWNRGSGIAPAPAWWCDSDRRSACSPPTPARTSPSPPPGCSGCTGGSAMARREPRTWPGRPPNCLWRTAGPHRPGFRHPGRGRLPGPVARSGAGAGRHPFRPNGDVRDPGPDLGGPPDHRPDHPGRTHAVRVRRHRRRPAFGPARRPGAHRQRVGPHPGRRPGAADRAVAEHGNPGTTDRLDIRRVATGGRGGRGRAAAGRSPGSPARTRRWR